MSTIHRDHFAKQSAATGFHEYLERHYIEVLDKRAKILEILEENQLVAEETLFIGDMQHDVETARHGGIYSCAVLTGYTGLEQLRASEPHLVVEHLGELKAILEGSRWEFPAAVNSNSASPRERPIATVGALIFNGRNEVLMIRTRKWSNLWGIPGGKIELGESSLAALSREIKEETNLDVENIRFVMVQDCIHSKEFYRDAHFILLNYVCKTAGPETVQLNDEAEEYRWIPLADVEQLELNQPTQILIEEVRQRHLTEHGHYPNL
jgi:ADP-ribose pyrophosphatase YjhB (NUDIX family)